jgi:hypothetical protein
MVSFISTLAHPAVITGSKDEIARTILFNMIVSSVHAANRGCDFKAMIAL